MIIYFSLYCLLGYFMESIYVSLFQRHWISSGLLKGPFIPLYGVGACLLIYFAPYLKSSIYLTIFVGGFMMTILEYLASLFIEKVFETKCWDYSHHRFHIQGRVCVIYFIMWCCLSYLFIFYIHPFFISLHFINDTMNIIALIYMAFILKALIDRLQFHKLNNGLDIH